MYELLIRIETLLGGLNPLISLCVGAAALVVGAVLWFAGTRYSAFILGVLGAIVGGFCGMLVDQLVGLHLLLSVMIGAAVFAAASVLLRNALIMVLAVLVCAALGGAGYLTVILDTHIEKDTSEVEMTARAPFLVQSFSNMDYQSRLNYLDQLSDQKEGFGERIRRLVRDTWESLGPNRWKLVAAVFAGGIVGLALVWFIKKAVVSLAYSVVGAAMIILGLQALLLAPRIRAISALDSHRTVVPVAFGVMVACGWLCQLWQSRKAQPVATRKTKKTKDEG